MKATEKQPRSNARSWRTGAITIAEVHPAPSGTPRVNLLAVVAPQAAAQTAQAIRATKPPTATIYLLGPTADGKPPTAREAAKQAAAKWIAKEPGIRGTAKPAKHSGRQSAKRGRAGAPRPRVPKVQPSQDRTMLPMSGDDAGRS